jgi:hypothetical protein
MLCLLVLSQLIVVRKHPKMRDFLDWGTFFYVPRPVSPFMFWAATWTVADSCEVAAIFPWHRSLKTAVLVCMMYYYCVKAQRWLQVLCGGPRAGARTAPP